MIKYFFKFTGAVLAIVILSILAGPFWALVPLVAVTIYFSPRIVKHHAWRLHDEAEQEAAAVRKFRKSMLEGEGPL